MEMLIYLDAADARGQNLIATVFIIVRSNEK